MSKLQNNFTTPEQSKRLLELGVPAWTADCFRWDFSSAFDISEDKRYSTSISLLCYEYQRDFHDKLPCWSVGRLIEIYLICNEVIDNVTELHHSAIKVDVREFNIVEYMIRKLSNKVKKNKSFFSKLEE